jgi:hypothetical protein
VIGNCFRERKKQGRFFRSPTGTYLRAVLKGLRHLGLREPQVTFRRESLQFELIHGRRAHNWFVTYSSIWSVVAIAFEFIS